MTRPKIRYSEDGIPNERDLQQAARWWLEMYVDDLASAVGFVCSTGTFTRFREDGEGQDSAADAEFYGLCDRCEFQKRCPHGRW